MDKSLAKIFKTVKDKESTWETLVGDFKTIEKASVEGLRLPQFTTKRKVDFEFNLFEKEKCGYDFILGRDFGQGLGINVLNDSKTFGWDKVEILMVPRGYWNDQRIENFHEECKLLRKQESHKAEILDAKYDAINVDSVIEGQTHLNEEQKKDLKKLLNKNIEAFKGTRG